MAVAATGDTAMLVLRRGVALPVRPVGVGSAPRREGFRVTPLQVPARPLAATRLSGRVLIAAPALRVGPLAVDGADIEVLDVGSTLLSETECQLLRDDDIYAGLRRAAQVLEPDAERNWLFLRADHVLWIFVEYLVMTFRAAPRDTVSQTVRRWTLAATPASATQSLRASVDYYRLVLLNAELGSDGVARLVMSGARRKGGHRS